MKKTCQICGRQIMAKKGRIAHHGYRRPWQQGWQTSSCFGAKHVPFEVSRDLLGTYISSLRDAVQRTEITRAGIAEERIPAVFHFQVYTVGRREPEERHVSLSRATFAEFYTSQKDHCVRYGVHRFEEVKERHLDRLDYNLKNLNCEISDQQKRFDTWKPVSAEVANGAA